MDHAENALRLHVIDELSGVVPQTNRLILGRLLNVYPSQIKFKYGPYGKPFLDHDGIQVYFNISHSDTVALCALSIEKEVGVDVEQARKVPEIESICNDICSVAELGILDHT